MLYLFICGCGFKMMASLAHTTARSIIKMSLVKMTSIHFNILSLLNVFTQFFTFAVNSKKKLRIENNCLVGHACHSLWNSYLDIIVWNYVYKYILFHSCTSVWILILVFVSAFFFNWNGSSIIMSSHVNLVLQTV